MTPTAVCTILISDPVLRSILDLKEILGLVWRPPSMIVHKFRRVFEVGECL